MQSSTEKWEEITRRMYEGEHIPMGYVETYWHRCSLCKKFGTIDCLKCPLNELVATRDTMKTFIYESEFDYNYAKLSLLLADEGKFGLALMYANIVLDRIKRIENNKR